MDTNKVTLEAGYVYTMEFEIEDLEIIILS